MCIRDSIPSLQKAINKSAVKNISRAGGIYYRDIKSRLRKKHAVHANTRTSFGAKGEDHDLRSLFLYLTAACFHVSSLRDPIKEKFRCNEHIDHRQPVQDRRVVPVLSLIHI